MRLKPVVQISSVVADFVGEVNELRLKGRALVEQIFTQLRIVSGTVIAGVFDDALTHLEGQIQSPKSRVAKLEILHDPQRLQVVVEGFTMSAHRRIQRLL